MRWILLLMVGHHIGIAQDIVIAGESVTKNRDYETRGDTFQRGVDAILDQIAERIIDSDFKAVRDDRYFLKPFLERTLKTQFRVTLQNWVRSRLFLTGEVRYSHSWLMTKVADHYRKMRNGSSLTGRKIRFSLDSIKAMRDAYFRDKRQRTEEVKTAVKTGMDRDDVMRTMIYFVERRVSFNLKNSYRDTLNHEICYPIENTWLIFCFDPNTAVLSRILDQTPQFLRGTQ